MVWGSCLRVLAKKVEATLGPIIGSEPSKVHKDEAGTEIGKLEPFAFPLFIPRVEGERPIIMTEDGDGIIAIGLQDKGVIVKEGISIHVKAPVNIWE